ncbi:hypothetical protein PybrP1_012398 [[Pythium] brassicae (nom. inval.)]|nr:hypothetical protein PybrP1_012398 [[Pythium] brassicae (nom. inval.)]
MQTTRISRPPSASRATFLSFVVLVVVVSQLLATALAAYVEVPPDAGIPGGGWRSIEPNKNDVARLITALRSERNYRATVKTRVCLFSLDMLYEQDFAAGANFQYHGMACQIDSAAGSGLCPNQLHTYELCNMYDIRLFEPKGTVNASQVLMIDYTVLGAPKDTLDVLNSSLPAASSESPTNSSAPPPLGPAPLPVTPSAPSSSAANNSHGASRADDAAEHPRAPGSSSSSSLLNQTTLRDSAARARPSVWLHALVAAASSVCIAASA